jgi:hypothetical protein
VRRPSTASGAARLHGSRSASILLETEQGGAASSQPVSRPSTATLPHLAKGAPSRDPTVVLLRQRNRQLEADIGAMEAHYRAQLQAYADSSRMFGFSRPPDKLVAYWAEAQLLLNRAIAEQYGSGRDADAEPGSSQLAAHRLSQQLSAAELRAVRTRYEHQVEHARSELVQAKADTTKRMHSNGWSPLFVAAGAGHLEAVRLLLECAPEQVAVTSSGTHGFWGLDIKAGLTPLDVARELHRDDVVQLLLFARGGEQ